MCAKHCWVVSIIGSQNIDRCWLFKLWIFVENAQGYFCYVCFYYAGGSESSLLARLECQPCTFILKAHDSITQSWHCSQGRNGMFCHLGGTPRLTFFCVKGLDEKKIERKKTKPHTVTARLRLSLPSKSELQKCFSLVPAFRFGLWLWLLSLFFMECLFIVY